MEGVGRPLHQLVEVAAALEVDEVETERTVGDAAHDLQHVVAHAEVRAVLLDARAHRRRDRHEQHLREQHRLEHAGAERRVTPRKRFRVFPRSDRLEVREIDGDAGHRLGEGLEHRSLHGGEPLGRGRRTGHAARDDLHLVGGRRDEVDVVSGAVRAFTAGLTLNKTGQSSLR